MFLHNLLNVLVQIANKVGLQKQNVEERRPPLLPNGQSSWLQIQRSGFDSRSYQIFREVVGLERGPTSPVSTIEELLGKNSIGSCLESREYSRRGSAALATRHSSICKS
jgi:hypothetical protein